MSLKNLLFLTIFSIQAICNNHLPVLYPERNSVGANRLARQIATITPKEFKSLLRQKLNPATPLKTDYGRMTLYGYLLFSERPDLARIMGNRPNLSLCPKEIVDYCSKVNLNVSVPFNKFNIGVNDLIVDGNTALHCALMSRWLNRNVIQTLLQMGANPESKNFKGENSQYLATLTGDSRLIHRFLSKPGAVKEETAMKIGSINNFHTANHLKILCQMTANHPLYFGILKGYLENRLIGNAEIFYIHQFTDTKEMENMLLDFALKGNVQAVNFLLEKGIPLTIEYTSNANPFSEDITILLCDKGFKPKFIFF